MKDYYVGGEAQVQSRSGQQGRSAEDRDTFVEN